MQTLQYLLAILQEKNSMTVVCDNIFCICVLPYLFFKLLRVISECTNFGGKETFFYSFYSKFMSQLK